MPNHILAQRSVVYISKTGSRNRIRIPVEGNKKANINPGDRVKVFYDINNICVSIIKDPNGNYKVEKDGAIRFPAHKYSLKNKDNIISANEITQRVICI
jgi:bifunctional DNA-binding transcriptional regulator/antitoxin component of YhaV-PrlF toxin-antitoxin module